MTDTTLPARSLRERLQAKLQRRGSTSNVDNSSYSLAEGVGGITLSDTTAPSSAVSAMTSIGSGGRTSRLNVSTSLPQGGATISSPPLHTSPSQRAMMVNSSSVTGGVEVNTSGTCSLHDKLFGADKRSGYYASKKVKLVNVEFPKFNVEGEGGLCGHYFTNTDRVCVRPCAPGSSSCGTNGHASPKVDFKALVPGAKSGWVVASKGSKSSDMVYRIPVIDAEKIVDKDLPKFEGEYNSRDGCEVILCAQKNYEQVTSPSTIDEEGEGDESICTEYSDITQLGDYSPDAFTEDKKAPHFTLNVNNVEDNELVAVLLEHELQIKEEFAHSKAIAGALPDVSASVVEHVSPKIEELIKKLNHCGTVLGTFSKKVGDVDDVQARGFESLADGLTTMLDFTEGMTDLPSLTQQVNDMKLEVHEGVDERILICVDLILNHIDPQLKELGDLIKAAEGGNGRGNTNVITPPPAGGTLSMSAVIVNDDGSPSITLGALLTRLNEQDLEISELKKAVVSQGGVVFYTFSWPHEEALEKLIAKEVPGGRSHLGNIFHLFPSCVDIFGHDKQAREQDTTTSAENKLLAAQGVKTKVERNVIQSFDRPVIPFYHKGLTMIEEGEVMDAVKSQADWEGYTGKSAQIMMHVDSSITSLNKAISDNLPKSTTLFALATKMAIQSQALHTSLRNHIDQEQTHLIKKMGIPADKAAVMLSEQLRIIMMDLFEPRKDVYAYDPTMPMETYTARIIWANLKCHEVAEKMMKDKFRAYPPIANAFLRFLTSQAGENTSSGLAANITQVEKNLKKEIKEVRATADKGKATAEGAKADLNRLLRANTDLKKG